MKRTLAALIITALCWAGNGHTAPAPYPVTINSRAQTAPPLPAFRANEHTFRVTFVDGATASDVSGYIPFLNWSTNRTATGVSTSSWEFVSAGTNGVVDFTFDPTALNHTEGRYVYEVGVKTSNDVVRAYAQGALMLYGSPTASGASVVEWLTMADWNLIEWSNLPDYQTGAQVAASIAAAGCTIDHSTLSNITWTASGHTGTPARLAGFFEGGAAGYSALGAGLYFDGSDNLCVSNPIITGAAAGATALPLAGGNMDADAAVTINDGAGTSLAMTKGYVVIRSPTTIKDISADSTKIKDNATTFEATWTYPTPTTAPFVYASREWATPLIAAKVDANSGTATNLTLIGAVTLTNSTSFAAGVYGTGTNGVYFTRDGTNYWILLQ